MEKYNQQIEIYNSMINSSREKLDKVSKIQDHMIKVDRANITDIEFTAIRKQYDTLVNHMKELDNDCKKFIAKYNI